MFRVNRPFNVFRGVLMNISMNRLLSMVAAAIMMLMSGAALAEDAPSLQEVQDELKKLQEKGGKAAQVAKDFMNSV